MIARSSPCAFEFARGGVAVALRRVLVPAAHCALGDVAQPHPSERRHQVMLQRRVVVGVDARSGSPLSVRRFAIQLVA
jgi:hypothetical protein